MRDVGIGSGLAVAIDVRECLPVGVFHHVSRHQSDVRATLAESDALLGHDAESSSAAFILFARRKE